MKTIRKPNGSVVREDAHGGEGGRKLYAKSGELLSSEFQAITRGYLPPRSKFSWHSHQNIEEMMLVLKGTGIFRDSDGECEYTDGDFFIIPADVVHEIENTSNSEEHEYIFVRLKIQVS